MTTKPSKATHEQARRALGKRIWSALWIDGNDGVRKGNTVFARGQREEDFVDEQTAIDVLEEIIDTLRADRAFDADRQAMSELARNSR